MKILNLQDIPEEGVSHNRQIQKRVMLRLGDLPQITQFAQARIPPNQSVGAHTHDDMSEVFFVESGEGIIQIDGQAHCLEAGVCIGVEPGEQHELVNTGSVDLVLMYFGVKAVC